MGCITELLGYSARLVCLFGLLQAFLSILYAAISDLQSQKYLQVHVEQEHSTTNEVDITLCPSPPINYTSLMEVGKTYRMVINQLEGELFAKMTRPYDVGWVFKEMNNCLLVSQAMKSTEDLFDKIDMANRIGCISKQAELMAKARHKTVTDFLKHIVIDHSYDLLASHFARKDSFHFYYSSETFRGIEYLKWDNLTVIDFLNRISVDPTEVVKFRSADNDSSWSVSVVHTRFAPACVRYRLRVRAEEGAQRLHISTFDLQSTLCQPSASGAEQNWRRDYCHSADSVGLLLQATTGHGFHALGGLYQRPPLWLPLDRSSVIELVASRKKKDTKYCRERGGKNSRLGCLRSCLIHSALDQIDCSFPWLEAKAKEANTSHHLQYCSTYESAAKALQISDGLLDHPERSACWEECAEDCSELHVDATLAGYVKQPKADQRRTITVMMQADLSHSTTARVDFPSVCQSFSALAAVAAFFSGVSLLSCSRWVLRLTLCLGGARRYLAALRPVCMVDLYAGRAFRRARVAHRWLWKQRPERPWLRPVEDTPQPEKLLDMLFARAALVDRIAVQRPLWFDTLVELDTESESDSASSEEGRDPVDFRGMLRQLRAGTVQCFHDGCGHAAEEEAIKEMEAELALEEELEHLTDIASLQGITLPPVHHQPRRSTAHGHGRQSFYGGSRRASLAVGDGRHSAGGNLLLSALGGFTEAVQFSASIHKHFGHRKSSTQSHASHVSTRRTSRVPSESPLGPSPSQREHERPPSPFDRRRSSLRSGPSPSVHDERRGHRPSFTEGGRGHRSSFTERGRGHRPSYYEERGHRRSYYEKRGHRPSHYEERGHRPSHSEEHGHRPPYHEERGHRPSYYDVRGRGYSSRERMRGSRHSYHEQRRGHTPSAHGREPKSPGDEHPSYHEEGQRPSYHRRKPSHYEHDRSRSPSFKESYERKPYYDDDDHGRRPSYYEEERRRSAFRGRGPRRSRGRGRGRGSRGRGRGARASVALDEAKSEVEHQDSSL